MTMIDTSSAVFKDTINGDRSRRYAANLFGLRIPACYNLLTDDNGTWALFAEELALKCEEKRYGDNYLSGSPQ